MPRDETRPVERFCALNAQRKTARHGVSRPLNKACRGAPRQAANRAHEGASLACLTPQRVAAAGAALLAAAAAAAAVAAAAAAAAAAAEAAVAAAKRQRRPPRRQHCLLPSPPEPFYAAPSAPPSPFTPAPPCCFAVQTGKVDDKILVLGKKIDEVADKLNEVHKKVDDKIIELGKKIDEVAGQMMSEFGEKMESLNGQMDVLISSIHRNAVAPISSVQTSTTADLESRHSKKRARKGGEASGSLDLA